MTPYISSIKHSRLLYICFFAGILLAACNNSDYNPPYLDPTFLNIAVSGAFTGQTVVAAGSQVEYGTYTLKSTSQYNWTVPPDATIISGSGTNIINVQFGLASGNVSVSAGNISGQITSVVQFTIAGPASASVGNTLTYTTTATMLNGVTYQWQVPAGATIMKGNGTNQVTVLFTGAGAKSIICTASDASTNRSDTLTVQVN